MDTLTSTSLTLTDEVRLGQICWTRLIQAVVDQGIPHVTFDQWPTETASLEPIAEYALSSYRGQHYEALFVDLAEAIGEPCLGSLSLQHGMFNVWLAAWSRETFELAREWLRGRVEKEVQGVDQRVTVRFWTSGGGTGSSTARKIDVSEWPSVRDNYPAAVRPPLDRLTSHRASPGRAGQLILWHGPPGTGKTSALRALAWEWREWCDLHYVTDPDALFGGSAGYLMEVLLDEDDDDDDEGGDTAGRWRLLVLEDTGELLSADAKERTGQGLSRLLNVVDGIVGQGLRLLVLVTTNEPLGGLHPAVTRPGRCLASVEFPEFPPTEAAAWLAERNNPATPSTALSLAELYALASGEDVPASRRHPIGFVR